MLAKASVVDVLSRELRPILEMEQKSDTSRLCVLLSFSGQVKAWIGSIKLKFL